MWIDNLTLLIKYLQNQQKVTHIWFNYIKNNVKSPIYLIINKIQLDYTGPESFAHMRIDFH